MPPWASVRRMRYGPNRGASCIAEPSSDPDGGSPIASSLQQKAFGLPVLRRGPQVQGGSAHPAKRNSPPAGTCSVSELLTMSQRYSICAVSMDEQKPPSQPWACRKTKENPTGRLAAADVDDC